MPDFIQWEKEIKKPTWYLQLVPEFRKLAKMREIDRDTFEQAKEAGYCFFEKHLLAGTVALGNTGKNWDEERKPIDTIIIHHTSSPPGMRESRLSAVELVRLYAPYYAAPYDGRDKEVTGQPVYSGHFRNGRQVFWPYHWLVRKDGSIERLLNDNEVGWQAGNWEINCRSVAICFDNDFEIVKPSEIELLAAARVIKENYGLVDHSRIFGHCEINTKTTCPSQLFLSKGDSGGWKEDLLDCL